MIQAGDKVKILNENADGTVKKILSNDYALVLVEDFEFTYPINNLVLIQGEKNHVVTHHSPGKIHPRIREIIREKESPASAKKIKFKRGKKAMAVLEIDLHGHEIIEDCKGIHKSKILGYQLNYFIRELEKAIARREKTIIFIHGKGEGILKAEIWKILNSRENLVFYDAPLKFYGGGATQVEIH